MQIANIKLPEDEKRALIDKALKLTMTEQQVMASVFFQEVLIDEIEFRLIENNKKLDKINQITGGQNYADTNGHNRQTNQYGRGLEGYQE